MRKGNVEIRTLVALAKAQGWEVLDRGGQIEFRSPSGAPPIRTANHADGNSSRGPHRANLVSNLQRAGLILEPGRAPKEQQPEMSTPIAEPTPIAAEAAIPQVVGDAIATLEEMLNELADQFATFRKHAADEQTVMRRDIAAQKARIEVLEGNMAKQADAWRVALDGAAKTAKERDSELATIREQMGELRAMVAHAARAAEQAAKNADPLAAFRKRLQ